VDKARCVSTLRVSSARARRCSPSSRRLCRTVLACAGSSVRDRVCWPFASPVRTRRDALGSSRSEETCDFVVGSVLFLGLAALDDVGAFDERYVVWAEEADWPLRARSRG